MHRAGGSKWHFSEKRGDPVLQFMFDVLLIDGVRVTPFTAHPPGDGSLRAEGLTADDWRRWLARFVKQWGAVDDAMQRLSPGEWPDRELLLSIADPVTLWDGTETVRSRLQQLWDGRAASAEGPRTWPTASATAKRYHELWRHLGAFEARLPTLRFFHVAYPEVVVDLVPPVSIVIGSPHASLDLSQHLDLAVDAASRLIRHGGAER